MSHEVVEYASFFVTLMSTALTAHSEIQKYRTKRAELARQEAAALSKAPTALLGSRAKAPDRLALFSDAAKTLVTIASCGFFALIGAIMITGPFFFWLLPHSNVFATILLTSAATGVIYGYFWSRKKRSWLAVGRLVTFAVTVCTGLFVVSFVVSSRLPQPRTASDTKSERSEPEVALGNTVLATPIWTKPSAAVGAESNRSESQTSLSDDESTHPTESNRTYSVNFGSYHVTTGDSSVFAIGTPTSPWWDEDEHPATPRAVKVPFKAGTDVIGDGQPGFVVTEVRGDEDDSNAYFTISRNGKVVWKEQGRRSEGMYTDIYFHIFEIGPTLKKLGTIHYGWTDGFIGSPFLKAPGVNGLLVEALDQTFWDWSGKRDVPHSGPVMSVLLSYRDGRYQVDIKFMTHPSPQENSLASKAYELLRNWPVEYGNSAEYDGSGSVPINYARDLLEPMLSLIYSGHSKQAWQFLNQAWPNDAPGKDSFLRKFKASLAQSPYWQAICAMNTDDPALVSGKE